ncbi:MAG: cytochrome d ubiquinol oxidase subunit II, partial [Adlercreutzia sp.]|nr:cytochrome d ubiquinol oxidase subunit II [Adlercreutzia sp.]
MLVGKMQGDDLKAFLAQSAAMIALVALLACSMFPTLVNATADSVGPAITIFNAASSELSLTCMTIITCIGLPLVLAYHVIIYRTFRGRVKPEDLQH